MEKNLKKPIPPPPHPNKVIENAFNSFTAFVNVTSYHAARVAKILLQALSNCGTRPRSYYTKSLKRDLRKTTNLEHSRFHCVDQFSAACLMATQCTNLTFLRDTEDL